MRFLIYTIARGMMKCFCHLYFRMRTVNNQAIPKEGSYLIACNHVSFLDPFIAGACTPRHLYFFARKTLFKTKIGGYLLRHMNALPVDRDGEGDVKALKTILKLLKQGEGVLIFPEGTRAHVDAVQDAKKGIGLMACKTQVPVIPVRIFGAFEAFNRTRKFPKFGVKVTTVFGEPLMPEDYDPGTDAEDRYQAAADKITEAMRALKVPV